MLLSHLYTFGNKRSDFILKKKKTLMSLVFLDYGVKAMCSVSGSWGPTEPWWRKVLFFKAEEFSYIFRKWATLCISSGALDSPF